MPELTSFQIEAFRSMALGFAFAGLMANVVPAVFQRPASFTLLQTGGIMAIASVPMLVFAAPFIIMRNTLRGRRFEKRPFGYVMLATVIACFWAMAAGRVLLDVLQIF